MGIDRCHSARAYFFISTNTAPGTKVWFVDSAYLYLDGYDETSFNSTPASPGDMIPRNLYRWYICYNLVGDEWYNSVSFVYGKAEPDNHSCQVVMIWRELL